MYNNIYLINWNLYFFQKKIHYEFLDSITTIIENIDFPDDIKNTKLLTFIKNLNNKKIIFPFMIPGKNYIKLDNFIYEILNQLLKIDLKNNTFYFFINDPFYANNSKIQGRKKNTIINLLYKNKNNNIKIINPIFSFNNLNFSNKNKTGCFPLVKNYNNILFFPYIHYCYKLSKMTLNINPIKKVLLSGAVHKIAYPDRYKFRNLIKKYYNYLKEYKTDRTKEVNTDKNIYNIELNKYLAAFYSGVYNTDDKFILLKIYEILGSGTLLLLEKKSKNICDYLGLKENEHYITINFDDYEKNIINKIKFILDDKNKEYILNIRKKGMNFCHEYLDYRFTLEKFLIFIKNNIL